MEELFQLLSTVADRGWRAGFGGVLRDADGRCPVCALAHEIDPRINHYCDAWGSGYKVGLREDDIALVAYAADKPSHPCRALLEQALGLRQ